MSASQQDSLIDGQDCRSVDLAAVIDAEMQAIAERRRFAGIASENGDFRPDNDLVGVALSGGGLRSAMFNLGLLQALHSAGFMRFVDYLSTVSGGGYIGGFYSTLGNELQSADVDEIKTHVNQAHPSSNSACGSDPSDADPIDARAPSCTYPERLDTLCEATNRFINGGQYLNQPWAFFSMYIWPTVIIFTLFVSALVAFASLVSIFFRCSDFLWIQDRMTLLGLKSEASFLIASIFALWFTAIGIYVIVSCLTNRSKKRSELMTHEPRSDGGNATLLSVLWKVGRSGVWLRYLVISALCGIAIALGNYDFGLFSGNSVQFRSEAQIPLIALTLLGVFALFRLPSLLNSEKATASMIQRIALWVILSCAVGGGSLAVLTYVGQEGISGFPQRRGPQFQPEEAINDRLFATVFLDQILTMTDKSEKLKARMTLRGIEKMREDTGKLNTLLDELDALIVDVFPDQIKCETDDQEKWNEVFRDFFLLDTFYRAGSYASALIPHTSNPVTEYLQKSAEIRKQRGEIFQTLNRILFPQTNPDFKPDILQSTAGPKEGRQKRRTDPTTKPLTNPQASPNLQSQEGALNQSLAEDKTLTQLILDAFQQKVLEDTVATKKRSVQSSKKAANSPTASEAPTSKTAEGFSEDAHAQLEVPLNVQDYLKGITINDRPFLGIAKLKEQILLCLRDDGNLQFRPGMFSWQDELVFRRHLLEATYPHALKQMAFVSSPVVVEYDQITRFYYFACSTLVFLWLFFTVDFNARAAVFRFYRDRIAKTFIKGGGLSGDAADIALSQFHPWKSGFPYPLICAALKIPQSVDLNGRVPAQLNRNPAKVDGSVGSEWYSFLMSPKYVGFMPVLPEAKPNKAAADSLPHQQGLGPTYRRTCDYLKNSLTVSDAITLSGAAFTPWMANSAALNLLMHVFNLRLEQWLPNPGDDICLTRGRSVSLPTMINEAIRCSTPEGLQKWQWGAVADGGFREFLGVEELIARRCRIIVVSDAGCNNGLSEFGVLADLVRMLRLDHNVEVMDLDHDLPLDTERMKRSSEGRVVQHFIVGRIRYPDDQKDDPSLKRSLYERTGLLVYVQMSLTGDEDVDLAQFQKINPNFPDEPITNQFFSEDQVESLRQLGEHVGKHLCQRLNPSLILAECGITGPQAAGAKTKRNSTSGSFIRSRRIEKLADGLISAYLVECRQEHIVGVDDTTREYALDSIEISDEAIKAFSQFEENGERSRILAQYASEIIDGNLADEFVPAQATGEKIGLFQQLKPSDLAGLAVECNRRHAGFRSENPDRFFRIAGRRLLLRSTSRAIEVCKPLDEKVAPDELPLVVESLLKGVARLAAVLPDGIFRSYRIKTSRDLTLCMLYWIKCKLDGLQRVGFHALSNTNENQLPPNQVSPFGLKHLDQWLYRSAFRDGLETVIGTGLAAEVEQFLCDVVLHGKPPAQTLQDQLGPNVVSRAIDEDAQQPLQVRVSTWIAPRFSSGENDDHSHQHSR